MNVAYTSTANVAMFVRPMAPIAPAGPTKLWMETCVAFQQSTAQEAFFGFATSTGLSSTIFATSTTLLSTCGLIGFWMHGDQPNNMDAVYQKPLNISSTSTTVITVLTSTLTSPANNPNPGNLAYVPTTSPGGFNGSNYIKIGVRTDSQYVYWYVNGAQVAKKLIDTTFDTTDSYGTLWAVGALGSAASDNVRFEFLRTAAQLL
jgi:hypothetical protein